MPVFEDVKVVGNLNNNFFHSNRAHFFLKLVFYISFFTKFHLLLVFIVSSTIYIWAFKVWYSPKLKVDIKIFDGNFSTWFTIFLGALALVWINFEHFVCSKLYLLLLSKCHHIQKHRPLLASIIVFARSCSSFLLNPIQCRHRSL